MMTIKIVLLRICVRCIVLLGQKRLNDHYWTREETYKKQGPAGSIGRSVRTSHHMEGLFARQCKSAVCLSVCLSVLA
jgi:hypothetical protein